MASFLEVDGHRRRVTPADAEEHREERFALPQGLAQRDRERRQQSYPPESQTPDVVVMV